MKKDKLLYINLISAVFIFAYLIIFRNNFLNGAKEAFVDLINIVK